VGKQLLLQRVRSISYTKMDGLIKNKNTYGLMALLLVIGVCNLRVNSRGICPQKLMYSLVNLKRYDGIY